MNVATVFPLWPGNVGLVQVAIATPLAASYGVAYAHGVAFGFGLQAIEASVGIGVGLMFLAREGLSFAMLQVMPSADQAEMAAETTRKQRMPGRARSRARLASRASSRRAPRRPRSRTVSRDAGVECVQLPLADGGEGTVEALGDRVGYWRVRDAFGRPATRASAGAATTVVEAAEVIPFDADAARRHRAPRAAASASCSRGSTRERLLVGARRHREHGRGRRAARGARRAAGADDRALRRRRRRSTTRRGSSGRRRARRREQVAELERRFRSLASSRPTPSCPGSGAAGGLGAALASLGAELVPGARTCSTSSASTRRASTLVVTGEGRVDATTAEGKAPAEVARRCAAAGVPCVVFGGVVTEPLPGVETVALSGDPARAADDLVELGLRLGTRLLDAPR